MDYETGNLSLPGIGQIIKLTYDQRLILEAITRKHDDDGAIWLDRIKNIRDIRNNTPKRNASLKRRAARCKVADRFANLFTMSYSGGTHNDVLRNLAEAELSGGQLLVNSLLTGVAPVMAIRRLRNLTQHDQLESTLLSIGLIARMEKRLAEVRFGVAFLHRLRSESVAADIVRIIDTEIITGTTIPNYWKKRLFQLASCYRLTLGDMKPMMPAVELHDHFGLAKFARVKKSADQQKPWEFDDLLPLIEASRQFDRKFMIARGVLPGGVDDVYLPRYIPQIKR